MTFDLITLTQCAALSGLGSKEMVLGVTPSALHRMLYANYLLHLEQGWEIVRDMIVADIRASLELGASRRAADLLIVLRRLLGERMKANRLQRTAKIVAIASVSRAAAGARFRRRRKGADRVGAATRRDNIFFLDCARPSRASRARPS